MKEDKKPTYKDIHGTTRIGDFLRKIGRSDILEKAFGVGKELLTGDIVGVLEVLLKSDKEFTEEQKANATIALKLDESEMFDITKRWESDMSSDSWLSKNARPLTLLYLVFTTTLIAVLDSSNALTVSVKWIQLLEIVLITVIAAYFGSRGFEKYKEIKNLKN